MPAIWLLVAILATAGGTAAGRYLMGPDATEQRTECVEKMVDALEPRTVADVRDIVKQCGERFSKGRNG